MSEVDDRIKLPEVEETDKSTSDPAQEAADLDKEEARNVILRSIAKTGWWWPGEG